MVKKRVFCIIEGCTHLALVGARVCRDHLQPTILQAEITRLRATRSNSHLAFLFTRFPDYEALGENLSALVDRADPLKGSQTAVTARSRGHNLTDGIVVLGGHIATPGYAASVRKDEGRLGAAVAVIAGARRKLDRMLDPSEDDARDDRPRCGRRNCPGRTTRQPVNIRFCGFCGRDMRESEAAS